MPAHTDPARPTDPLHAVVHPDPSTYYDELAAHAMSYDSSLGLWVASSAADVDAVIEHRALRVRPSNAPVPTHLIGTAAGEVFGRLVRMNDDTLHRDLKTSIAATLAAIGPDEVDRACRDAVENAQRGDLPSSIAWSMDEFPTLVLGRLVGVEPAALSRLVAAARVLAIAFGPGTPPADTSEFDAAATELLGAAQRATQLRTRSIATLLAAAVGPAAAADTHANLAGLFFQNFDASSGLIGNSIARWMRSGADDGDARAIVEQTLHLDPPIQNTRRFAHERARVAGCDVAAGDTILLVLAAANRDRKCAPDRDGRFGVGSFGHGAHRCPATDIAPRVAAHALASLIQLWGPDARRRVALSGYRPSLNARIPMFTQSS